MHSEYQLSLPAQTIESAAPAARQLLEEARSQLGFVPHMYARMANLPALLSTYSHGYQLFRQEAGFTAVEQEVVFLAISVENGCEYCVAAHSLVADAMSRVPTAVTNALRDGQPAPDAKLAALAEFTRIIVAKRGLPSASDVAAFLSAGYEEQHVLGVLLAVAVKTISNYTNHLFHTPLDAPFTTRAWSDPRMK